MTGPVAIVRRTTTSMSSIEDSVSLDRKGPLLRNRQTKLGLLHFPLAKFGFFEEALVSCIIAT